MTSPAVADAQARRTRARTLDEKLIHLRVFLSAGDARKKDIAKEIGINPNSVYRYVSMLRCQFGANVAKRFCRPGYVYYIRNVSPLG